MQANRVDLNEGEVLGEVLQCSVRLKSARSAVTSQSPLGLLAIALACLSQLNVLEIPWYASCKGKDVISYIQE